MVKKSSRIISVLLSLALVLGMIGVPALADGANSAAIPPYIETTTIGGVEYLVFDAAEDLVWLRDHINNKEDGGTTDAYYCTHNIILTANIDMEGFNGTGAGIGSGKTGIGFSGIFDGGGHTISNLEVTGVDAGPRALLFNLTKNATIKNVTVQGTVDANRFVGGVVGRTLGSLTLSSVAVDADLTLNDGVRNAVGGLIGQIGSGKTAGGETISITNCAAFGTYASEKANCPVGGLIGYIYGGFDVKINHSYAAADLHCTEGGSAAGLIAGQGTATLEVTNCYYLDSMAQTPLIVLDADETNADIDADPVSDVGAAAKSETYMKSADFLTDLGGAFVTGANGYPVPATMAARIGGTEYRTLADAIAAAQTGDTVTLLADTEESVTVPAAADIILELNGKTLTGTVTSAGALTIRDSAGGGKVTAATATAYALNVTGGTLNVTGGSFTASKHTVYNNGGTVYIGGDGTTLTTNGITASAVYNNSGSTTITGGIFTGKYSRFLIYAQTGAVQISGGTFSSDVTSYVADDYKVVGNSDGTYTVVFRYVASVTDSQGLETRHETVADAVAAALDGGTVTLLADAAEDVTVPGDANLTLELNGKTLTGTVTNAGTLTIQDSAGGGAVTASGGDAVMNTGALTITGGTFSSDVTPYVADGYKVVVSGNGAYTVIENKNYAACVTSGDLVTNYETLADAVAAARDGGVVTLLTDVGESVVNSGTMTLELNGRTLTGTVTNTGTLTIRDSGDGGRIIAATATSYAVNNGGSAQLIITGGIFSAAPGYGAINAAGAVRITGGIFSSDITPYVADGYEVTANGDGTYTVVEATGYAACVNSGDAVTYYETLTDAISSAEDGGTVTLLSDVEESVINSGTIILELNGKALTGTVTNTGVLTIQDSTGGGKIAAATTTSYAVNNGTGAQLTITGGTYTAAPGYGAINTAGTVQITGGTFSSNVTDCLANGYMVVENQDGTYTVTVNKNYTAAVSVGGTVTNYVDLTEAVAAAANGGTVVLLADVEKSITNSGIMTLELNGKALTGTVTNTGELTVQDSVDGGAITASGYAVYNISGGSTTITGGSITSQNSYALYNASGNTVITGGTFTAGANSSFVIYANTTQAKVRVSGGTFSMENICNQEYLAEGYMAVGNPDGTYTVKSKTANIPNTITTTTINGVEYLEFDSADDMVWLRDHINNQEDGGTTNAYYCTHNIILTADIDMAGSNGSMSGIGSGQDWSGYSGIFDGNGHTISNLYVTGVDAGPRALLFNLTKDATIKNVAIQGTVTANRFIGGVVGRTLGSLTLDNVAVNADLTLNDGVRNAVGGLIGQMGSGKTTGGETISITNCAAVGSFTSTTASNPVGGLVGYIYGGFTVRIENSYAAAALRCTDGMTEGTVAGLIAGQGTSSLQVTNCYYLNTMAATPLAVLTSNADENPVGPLSYFVQAAAKSSDYMKSGDFLTDLHGAFTADGTPSLTQGYPVPAGIIVNTKTAGIVTEVKDGVATVTVNSDVLGETLKTANDGTQIVFTAEIPENETVSVVTLELSASDTAIIAQSGVPLKVASPIADVTLSNAALKALAAQSGRTVTVTAEAENTGATAITVAVDGAALKSVSGGIKAAIPAVSGQVAVLVAANGSQSVIPKSVVEGGTAYVPLSGSAAVKVINNARTFADVNASDWYSSYVDFASSHELFNGVSNTEFAPNTPMTRAMLVTVLHRLESTPAASVTNVFDDVPFGTWYTDAVIWASANKIVEGYGDGSFGSGDSVTREQLATILYRYMQYLGLDVSTGGSLSGFADSGETSAWAWDAVQWAVGAGIIEGKSGTVLDPRGEATRAEVATMLQRLIRLIVL